MHQSAHHLGQVGGANIKATAATKCAPFLTSGRAAASAEKEQNEDAAPKKVESDTLLKSVSPIYLVSSVLDTKA